MLRKKRGKLSFSLLANGKGREKGKGGGSLDNLLEIAKKKMFQNFL